MTPPILCPVCGSSDLNAGHRYTNVYWFDIDEFNNLNVIACQSCGFGFSWPELSDSAIESSYANSFHGKTLPFYIDFSKLSKMHGNYGRWLSQILLAKHFVIFNRGGYFPRYRPRGECLCSRFRFPSRASLLRY